MDPRGDAASLVDISFLLLIFFVVTSTILKKEADLDLAIPPPGESDPVPALPVWITIAADGSVALGKGEGTMPMAADDRMSELSGHLAMARDAAKPENLPVVLDVADGASQGSFIAVLDCLAGLGIGQVTMLESGGEP